MFFERAVSGLVLFLEQRLFLSLCCVAVGTDLHLQSLVGVVLLVVLSVGGSDRSQFELVVECLWRRVRDAHREVPRDLVEGAAPRFWQVPPEADDRQQDHQQEEEEDEGTDQLLHTTYT